MMMFNELDTKADEWVANGRARIGKRVPPDYAATKPQGHFLAALSADADMAECLRIGGLSGVARYNRLQRDTLLLQLTVRALHNQGEPYYPSVKES